MKLWPAPGLDREWVRRLGRAGWLVVGGALALVVVSTAFGSSSWSDKPGDANEAPDISSVTVEGGASAAVSVRVEFANVETLPEGTQVVLRLDLDASPGTGVNGYELAVAYRADGALDASRFDGITMAPVDASGARATATAGALTLTLDRALLGSSASALGVSVVASRTQQVGAARIVASDFAPDAGEHPYRPPAELTFPDARSDEGAAPDVTSVEVSDSPRAVVFKITTPNYASLPPGKEVGLALALAGRAPADDELFLTYVSAGARLVLEREEHGLAVPLAAPTRAEASFEGGALAVSVKRSELEGAGVFRFGVVTADLVSPGEGEGAGSVGELEAVDVAPDGLLDDKRYTYRLANPPPLRLATDTPSGIPLVPVAGRSFEVSVLVRRSDAFGVVRSGSVGCSAAVGGRRVRASGRFAYGRAQCRLLVPKTSRAVTLWGAMTIRAAGKAVTSRFAFPVRRASS